MLKPARLAIVIAVLGGAGGARSQNVGGFAAASGRELGEVRQILSLTRGVEGDKASVTLAVRFAFRPKT